jgi:hypothetical protein
VPIFEAVIAMRSLHSSLPPTVALTLLLAVTGCGGASGPGSAQEYPLVDGSSSATPRGYETDPSPSCEREIATFHDGSEPAKRPIVIPPAPGLRATAVTEHTTRLEWSFRDLPDDCRPVELLISVVASGRSTPTTKQIKISSVTGTAELAYPEFLPAPDVALASAYSREGHRSRTVSVLIRSTGDVPPDPPEPAPPVTAPAGEPVRCEGRPTAVDDPAGDVLTYEVGSPPHPVRKITPALSGIDLRRATFQIDDRTICAAFVFADPPPSAVQLTLTLRDVTTPACCASLRFRRTAGGLEVGHLSVDANGAYRLEPVPDGGASLRGDTLVITGTLPPPSKWQLQTHRVPVVQDIGWSVTTGYAPDKYGPSYADWLPRYEDVGEPVIRHRDGATVTPGVTR